MAVVAMVETKQAIGVVAEEAVVGLAAVQVTVVAAIEATERVAERLMAIAVMVSSPYDSCLNTLAL